MRALITLITALLLFVACSTSRNVSEKEKGALEQAATFEQTATTKETTDATLDQATLEQILKNINVTFDWERWEFGQTSGEAEGQPTTMPTPRDKEATTDKPPNDRPTSVTKGSVKINSEQSENRLTQTAAETKTNRADSIATAATAEKKEQTQKEAKEKAEAKKSPAPFFALLAILIAAGFCFLGCRQSKKP